MSVFFKFGDFDVLRQAATIIDSGGDPCGTIMLDGFEETKFFDGDEAFELLHEMRSMSVLPEDEEGYSMVSLPGIDCYRVMLVHLSMISFHTGPGSKLLRMERFCTPPIPRRSAKEPISSTQSDGQQQQRRDFSSLIDKI
jgi:hypothetical protein